MISVMNKCDKVGDIYSMPTFGKTVLISALEGRGLDNLLEAIVKELPPTRRKVKLLIPFQYGALAARVRKEGAVENEEYRPEGLYMEATVHVALLDELKQFIVD